MNHDINVTVRLSDLQFHQLESLYSFFVGSFPECAFLSFEQFSSIFLGSGTSLDFDTKVRFFSDFLWFLLEVKND